MDTVADMLTIIRNGYLARKIQVVSPHSKAKEEIAKKLLKIGFLDHVAVKKDENRINLIIKLKYENGEPVLTHLKRISKPGLRIYKAKRELKPVLGGIGFALLSTSRGIMTNKEAHQKGIGGEIVCEVW
ncbi:MAG: 30S ribosomal protein S8 [Candidatus Woykebacteria bacterium]